MLGEGGLGGRYVDMERNAVTAVVVVGVAGGEKWVELGLDGEARGMMSLGSETPE